MSRICFSVRMRMSEWVIAINEWITTYVFLFVCVCVCVFVGVCMQMRVIKAKPKKQEFNLSSLDWQILPGKPHHPQMYLMTMSTYILFAKNISSKVCWCWWVSTRPKITLHSIHFIITYLQKPLLLLKFFVLK